ncbi:hypothetical protein [Bacteroides mediterraneensis]|uniref:hypothetical protein n=1 Tax=Bacteroides mediterraneensis TaxID=1841856 RepID=UPI00195CA005|nr:hypothetical protein [Bacteroides mediterraneensis]MBM6780720.1 hypothetical protein [Bacteroides mediterraneensis]
MKFSKGLFLAFAGLGLFACSNEDVNENGGVQGNAVVGVKISDPALSRAVAGYTASTDVTLNRIRLVLTAQTGGSEKTFNLGDYDSRQDLLDAVNEFQFTGVRNPSKMEVYINTDKSSGWTSSEFMAAGLAEPLYASSTTFVNQGDTDTDGIDEYKVTLEPAHTMARLEFGGIAHVDTEGKDCIFQTIKIDGVILDGVTNVTQVEEWDASNSMSNTINEDFTEATGSADTGWTPSWPENNQCYAYNIAPIESGDLPILKVCFSNISIKSNLTGGGVIAWNPERVGYATVKNYKLTANSSQYATAFGVNGEGNITKFPAGYIYQVKSLAIPDEAIGQGWQGGEDIHVIAYVTVKSWTIAEGTVVWN